MSARLSYNIRVLFSRLKRPGFIRYGLLILGPLILALVGAYYYAIGGLDTAQHHTWSGGVRVFEPLYLPMQFRQR